MSNGDIESAMISKKTNFPPGVASYGVEDDRVLLAPLRAVDSIDLDAERRPFGELLMQTNEPCSVRCRCADLVRCKPASD